MGLHEEKYCPRCGNAFECKAGNIQECQCTAISLTEEEGAFIEEKYNDCLCRNCLIELKEQYGLLKEKHLFNPGS